MNSIGQNLSEELVYSHEEQMRGGSSKKNPHLKKMKKKELVEVRLGYIRVSTAMQNLDRQEKTMRDFEVEKVFSEKVSGKNTDRPKLQEMLEFAREGDTIYVSDFSRLARSTKDLLTIVEDLTKRNIHLVSAKEQIDTSTAAGRLLLTICFALTSFERDNLLERQAEGIAEAKKRGVYKGRKPIEVKDFEKHYERWKSREVNKTQLAKELGISRQTLHGLFKKYEETLK